MRRITNTDIDGATVSSCITLILALLSNMAGKIGALYQNRTDVILTWKESAIPLGEQRMKRVSGDHRCYEASK